MDKDLKKKIIKNFSDKDGIPYQTLGSSMWPLLRTDNIIYLKYKSFEKIVKGDIAAIYVDKKIIAHRVIYKYKDFLITKGDNCSDYDNFIVTKDNILGVVDTIKKRGGVKFNSSNFFIKSYGCFVLKQSRIIPIFHKIYKKILKYKK